MSLDDFDRRLIDRIQRDFPVEPRPFEALARELGADEAVVIERVRALQDAKLVRQIGPVFDLHRLGYTSTLCAAEVDAGAVEAAAETINAYAEVTHNYLREANFNMWFTLVAPSQDRIDEILAEVGRLPGVREVISLPAEKTFKINVYFALSTSKKSGKPERKTGTDSLFGSLKSVSVPAFRGPLIQALQNPLPLVERPYREIANQTGLTEDEVIARIRQWLDAGVIRRFGARVKHHAIGYTANGMSVWDVPPEQTEAAGQYMASLPEVSHCYTRPRTPKWPYNLYAMIHGQAEAEVRAVAEHIAAHLDIASYQILFSTRELKKAAPKFF